MAQTQTLFGFGFDLFKVMLAAIVVFVLYLAYTFLRSDGGIMGPQSTPVTTRDPPKPTTPTSPGKVGIDLLPGAPATMEVVSYKNELSFDDDYIAISHSDAEFVQKGLHVCVNGRSHRVAYVTRSSEGPQLVTFEDRLDGIVRPGDVFGIGDCSGNPWKAAGSFNAVPVDENAVRVIQIDENLPRTVGVARADGMKLSVGDPLCMYGRDHRVERITPGSAEVDLVQVTFPFKEPLVAGDIITKGVCPSEETF